MIFYLKKLYVINPNANVFKSEVTAFWSAIEFETGLQVIEI
jgi:hypothetical protein